LALPALFFWRSSVNPFAYPEFVLHVTNGGCAATVIRATGLDGDVLCWNDVLHEGPVPCVASHELRGIRAAFLGGTDWTTTEEALRGLTLRDERLADAAREGDVVLWFEHDLYDQLQLIQVIDQLAEQDIALDRVTLICGAEYLGLSTPERLRARFPLRAPITADMVSVARRAWAAFRDPEPTALVSLLESSTDRESPLPFAAPALRRHLQQFPSTFNGLSRSEQQALEEISAGATRLHDVFERSHQQREEAFFLGDTVFADYMNDLSSGPAPLVALRHGARVDVTLTDTGAAVLRGESDRVHVNGIDRWFGGVHLEGHEVAWRWDGSSVRRQ
jgi:Domain of unknown function (DUF1835)